MLATLGQDIAAIGGFTAISERSNQLSGRGAVLLMASFQKANVFRRSAHGGGFGRWISGPLRILGSKSGGLMSLGLWTECIGP